MCKLLYFPYISIPNASWLKQALLYWDGVATIVPTDYLRYPSQFSSFARELVRENIVQAIQPEEYANAYYEEFRAFLEWAKMYPSHFLLSEASGHGRKASQVYVHTGKLGSVLGSGLIKLQYARRIDDQWYEMNGQLSMCFMAFLAILIGREEDYVPMTDFYQGMSTLFDVTPQPAPRNARRIRAVLRNTILEDIFPVPDKIEDLNDLLRFKDRYFDELQSFRRHIEDFLISLDGLPEELQRERCQNFRLNVQDELEEIKGHMGRFCAPQINFGTLVPVLPCIYETVKGNPVGAGVGMAAVFGQMIWNDERKRNLRKPLAYAALYRDRFYGWRSKLRT